MPTLREYLAQYAEPQPDWLAEFRPGDGFDPRFFESRTVYYPGSGFDGQPVALFNSTRAAHCFIYVDYGVERNALERELDDVRHGFAGYHQIDRVEVQKSDLAPNGWTAHVRPRNESRSAWDANAAPFAFLEILERDAGTPEAHGARRIAILFLFADGIAAYDAMFCQVGSHRPPYAVILRDHGWGGNYDRFGAGGLMEDLIDECGVRPDWLLVDKNTGAWRGYVQIPGVDGQERGIHGGVRYLFSPGRAVTNPGNK